MGGERKGEREIAERNSEEGGRGMHRRRRDRRKAEGGTVREGHAAVCSFSLSH